MNTPQLPESSQKPNKLIIRSEVLAVIRHLVSLDNPPRQERIKQVKRLHELNCPDHIQDVLVKELSRCKSTETVRVITELLMEFGEINYLQDKLWNIIRDLKTTDEVKDASNLILRHLGDTADPDLYLEYLSDPQALIGRETIRMLEVSAENPEALIDFIDFILSLTQEDQIRLVKSLQEDYPSEYLVNIYIPLLESDPSPELWEQLIINLGETKSSQAAELLTRLSQWPEDRLPVPRKMIEKSLKQLRLAGACHIDETPVLSAPLRGLHPVVKESAPYHCFVTLSDGIGNQGLLFSRKRSNGDITMLSVAINDEHGIIDCFGFYQLSPGDFQKITEKFHEGSTKIKVSPEYCAYKLQLAEALNMHKMFRLPYEYRCWKPLIEDLEPLAATELKLDPEWIKEEWYLETDNLYQHPDFNSWFLEQGDEPCVTRSLQKVILLTEDCILDPKPDMEYYFSQLESVANQLMLELLGTHWRQLLIHRLTEAAYLLHCQNTRTFRNLAATEAYKLKTLQDPETLLEGFTRAYGRRCIAEELLRLRTGSSNYERLSAIVDALLERWKL